MTDAQCQAIWAGTKPIHGRNWRSQVETVRKQEPSRDCPEAGEDWAANADATCTKGDEVVIEVQLGVDTEG